MKNIGNDPHSLFNGNHFPSIVCMQFKVQHVTVGDYINAYDYRTNYLQVVCQQS